jgi:hypothetical protein
MFGQTSLYEMFLLLTLILYAGCTLFNKKLGKFSCKMALFKNRKPESKQSFVKRALCEDRVLGK